MLLVLIEPFICFCGWLDSIWEEEGGDRRLVTVVFWDVGLHSFFALAGLSWLDDDIKDGIVGKPVAGGIESSASIGEP